MRKEKWIGLIILTVVVVLSGLYLYGSRVLPQPVELQGLLGGEKIGLFESEEFKKIMNKRFALTLDYRKAGSFAMTEETAKEQNQRGYDYLFPASQLAEEYYKKLGGKMERQDIVFNTPMVIYSRKPVVEALKKQTIVQERDGILYVDMPQLADLIAQGTSWADLGLPYLYGNVFVITTDPNASNSGNMFLGLLANSLNRNRVLSRDQIPEILPQLRAIYQQIGNMQTSSADVFNQFLRLGIGSYPMIAGYENQILELSKTEADIFDKVKDELCILYPEPTIWSSHVYIALTPDGERGLEALLDPEVQQLAWKNHGFRTIVSGTADPGEFNVRGIPENINQVMPMPGVDVMFELMRALKN